MVMQTASQTISTPVVSSRQRTAGIVAMLLGSTMLFLVGFAPMPAVHNAAHDTRHSASFPCH